MKTLQELSDNSAKTNQTYAVKMIIITTNDGCMEEYHVNDVPHIGSVSLQRIPLSEHCLAADPFNVKPTSQLNARVLPFDRISMEPLPGGNGGMHSEMFKNTLGDA